MESKSGGAAQEVLSPESPGAPKATHVYSMRVSDLSTTVILALLTTLMILLATADINASGWELIFTRIIGGAGALFGGWGSSRWLTRLWNRSPQLSLTAEGFADRSSFGSPLSIRWAQVQSLEATSRGLLEIKLFDPESARIPWNRKWVTRFLRSGRDVDLLIPIRGLELPKEAIASEVITRHTEHLLNDVRAQQEELDSGDQERNRPQELASPETLRE